jgi:hypothetical protein
VSPYKSWKMEFSALMPSWHPDIARETSPRHDELNVPNSCTRVAAYRSKGNLNLACELLLQLFFRRVLQICTLGPSNEKPLKPMFFNMFRQGKFAMRNIFKISLTGYST